MRAPPGLICLWSGSIATIPAGWHLCDGDAGTPDLRDQFVVGAGSTYDPADSGGTVNHNHDFTGDGHTHLLTGGADIAAGSGYRDTTDSSPAAGTTDNGSSLPPYYSLAYIMLL